MMLVLTLQNLVAYSVNMADNLMLGSYSQNALSGAATVNQIFFMVQQFALAFGNALVVLASQYWGENRKEPIRVLTGIALKAGLFCGIVIVVLCTVMPKQLLGLFTNAPEIINQGLGYLDLLKSTFAFYIITNILMAALRSVEIVNISFYISVVSLIINVAINYTLIFGRFGMPEMGIMGAAIGTLTARIVELIIVIWYAKVKNHDVRFHPVYMRKIDKVLLKDFLIYASPVILNEMMWGLGVSANTAVIGHLGSAAVASNSVAQVARQLAQVVVFGIANATAVYLGKTIGERKFDYGKAYAKRFIRLALIMGCCGACVILICAPIANTFLVLSPEAKEYLYMMFGVMSYFVIAQAVNTTLVVGVFRSGGDTRFGLILDVSTMWGFSILLGAVAAFFLHASVPAVYILLMSDELVKLPLTLKRYRSYKWLKDVTRNNLEI